MEVKYIGYYDKSDTKSNRNIVLAATNKMTYIISAIEKAGYSVSVISASEVCNPKGAKAENKKLSEKSSLHLFGSLPYKTGLGRVISRKILKIKMFFYLLNNLKKTDTVMVYHSLGYMKTITFLKKLIGFNLVLEVEEIYGDVISNEKTKRQEIPFFYLADEYVFPTELLSDLINIRKKPECVIYGAYSVEAEHRNIFNDNKKHILYAGTLDPRKGCLTAVRMAEHLDNSYHIHILGFGNEADKRTLTNEISTVVRDFDCEVTFDGLLSGDEYTSFVQSCDVGLSSQSPDAQFNETSFPSKVLSYLSNGLRVVSIRIKSIERSKVSDLLYFYDEDNPEALAKAIKDIDFNENYDSRSFIKELDNEFTKNIASVLSWQH